MARVVMILMDTEKTYQHIASLIESGPVKPCFGLDICTMRVREVAFHGHVRDGITSLKIDSQIEPKRQRMGSVEIQIFQLQNTKHR